MAKEALPTTNPAPPNSSSTPLLEAKACLPKVDPALLAIDLAFQAVDSALLIAD